jgi:hypothetical protein
MQLSRAEPAAWRGIMAQEIDFPAHVGPCEFSTLGKLIAVRCPKELAHILHRAGAVWEPGSRRWLCSGGASGQ